MRGADFNTRHIALLEGAGVVDARMLRMPEPAGKFPGDCRREVRLAEIVGRRTAKTCCAISSRLSAWK